MLGPEQVVNDVVRWLFARRMIIGIDLKNNSEWVLYKENKDCFHQEKG